ncbi:orotate phosphoribosyltransferase [Candidatus Methylospira mobilis]|uniref:Orotate phosphoribosyltransferase n=1 Tax=Candidatus Methylospira mobilis TaxID=1808979 RepID=A0A5Q0BRB8_9GAMM|nr:orotate phosphoribosyltransferase [Candidatus Methylospira mobilis]QFY44226.1 orotate phosphoribosyltransferase [Candidatus Methylospira mobilis]WNV06350.1 orotate phosphoribosyltransferase [Candidatus Methylospira mobilis]
MLPYQQDFIEYAIGCGVLKFGAFTLKSGRSSPYFFNTGMFDSGARLGRLGEFYAQACVAQNIGADILYGPAYKGIPLVSATAIALAKLTGKEIPFAFNRKEAKDHGEGGVLVGAPLNGDVLIVDDVITAGTSVRESVVIIREAGANPCGVLIALDRQERGQGAVSAIDEVRERYALQVFSIVTLSDIVAYLQAEHREQEVDDIAKHRRRYGV